MNKITKSIIVFLIAPAMLLTSCGNGSNELSSSSLSDSSQTSSIETGNTHYNADNFNQSDKVVAKTKVVTYPGPSIMTSSTKVGISIENQNLFVYETRVNFARSFTYDYSLDTAPVACFDFEGEVHVKITVNEESVTSALVSPLVYGINPDISSNIVEFDISNPDNYTIELNGDYKTAIHLFANPIEENAITAEQAARDPSIIYLGPGLYKADAIPMTSNQTLYLAGGAYVFGQVITDGLNNITIRGRGILDGSIYDRKSASEYLIPLQLTRTKNVLIEGISILDPAGWAVAIIDCENVTIDNLKIITARANGDGISIQSSQQVIVNGGFVRTWDDSLVVKNVNRGSTADVTFDGVTVWTDLAQSMEVGYETNGPAMDDITFKNITILHNFHKAVISLHNCDDAEITNVSYENITLEDGEMLGDVQTDSINDFFIDFTIAYSAEWTKSGGKRGSVDGITIKNVNVYEMADTIVSRMNGEDDDSSINNVSIQNVNIMGKKVSSSESLKLTTNDYIKNLSVGENSEQAGAIIKLQYKYQSGGISEDITNVEGISQNGIIVPQAFQFKDNVSYIGVKADASTFNVSITHGIGTTTTAEYDDGTGNFDDAANPGSNLIDNDRSTYLSSQDYTGESGEFIAVTVTFGTLVNLGVVRLLGLYNNDFYSRYSISLFGRKLKTDGTENEKFVRVLSTDDYEITPATGNACDIKFTPIDYLALQLRFFRKDGLGYQSTIKLGSLEFYPPSLTYNKPIVDASANNDVYSVSKINDGQTSGTSYYESSSLPAYVVIDMKDLYTIKYIVMNLPSLMSWSARTENIQIMTSLDNFNYDASNTTFTELVPATDYLFDPVSGNINVIDVSSKNVKARFIKLIISSNSAEGGYGAQLSELSVYGS